jgi:hypothetical protein
MTVIVAMLSLALNLQASNALVGVAWELILVADAAGTMALVVTNHVKVRLIFLLPAFLPELSLWIPTTIKFKTSMNLALLVYL